MGTVSHPVNHFRRNADDNLDTPKIFYVDPSNHLIVQRLVLVSAVIQPQSGSQDDSGSTALAVFNPFKVSPEHTVPPDNRGETCRLTLEGPLDIGELKPCQRLKGLRLFFTKDRIRGIAWSDSEIYVSDA